MPSFPRALNYILALTLTLSALGCAAKDKHVFVSTVSQPTSLALLDTYSNETVWELDIPVNHKLVLDFEGTAGGKSSEGVAPSWVNCKLYRADDLPTDTGRARRGSLVSKERIDITGKKVLMQVSHRPAPEIPGSIDAAPVPVQETTQSVADEAIAESKAQADTDEAIADDAPEDAAMDAVEDATEDATEDVTEDVTEEAVEDAAEVTDIPAVEEGVEEAAEAVEEASAEVEEVVEDAVDAAATQPTK